MAVARQACILNAQIKALKKRHSARIQSPSAFRYVYAAVQTARDVLYGGLKELEAYVGPSMIAMEKFNALVGSVDLPQKTDTKRHILRQI